MIHYRDYDIDTHFNPVVHTKRDREGNVSHYCNNIIVVDTEVTSVWLDDDNKWRVFDLDKAQAYYRETGEDYYIGRESTSWVYIWMVSIDGVAVYGRYIEEYKEFMQSLSEHARGYKLIVWIQNLAYEFQVLLRNLYTDMEVFARTKRKPMKVSIGEEFEYRDLLIYTNQSLENLGKHNEIYKKLVGDLDYNVMRFSDTPLTDEEMGYCENDVLVPYEYLLGELHHYKKITSLPLTQTGKSRRALQKAYKGDKFYNKKCRELVPKLKVFKLLKRAFQGGYTHANACFCDDTILDVYSWDFKSSYPAVMVCEKYPYGRFLQYDKPLDGLDRDKFCWVGVLRLYNVRSNYRNNYISSYHCDELSGSVTDNGRVVSAKYIEITLTDVDWDIIQNTYTIESYEEVEIWISRKKYLDKRFVNLILDSYQAKTELKNVDGKEDLYNRSKELLNSYFGMAVTNLVSDEISYTDDWEVEPVSDGLARKQLQRQADNRNTLTVYAHGVFITAYARKNLWWGITRLDSDVIYCDTDSIKHLGRYDKVREEYNDIIRKKMQDASIENDFDIEKTRPRDIYGNIHELGTFDDETEKGAYKEFRTLGAKRYSYRDYKGNLHITVSGVSKKKGVNALNDNIENFTEGLLFDYVDSGKMLSQYNDNQPIADIEEHHIDVLYGVTLRPTTYKLTMSDKFLEYIMSTKTQYQITDERRWLKNDE